MASWASRGAVMGAAVCLLAAACSSGGDEGASGSGSGAQRFELPRMLNAEPPFRYPPPLYAQKTQANVMLRLFIDSLGAVVPESTMVVESSGVSELDSAAVTGSAELAFAPARRNGAAVSAPVLLPVHFRHPDAPPLPGDSAPMAGVAPAGAPAGSVARP